MYLVTIQGTIYDVVSMLEQDRDTQKYQELES